MLADNTYEKNKFAARRGPVGPSATKGERKGDTHRDEDQEEVGEHGVDVGVPEVCVDVGIRAPARFGANPLNSKACGSPQRDTVGTQ